jgi:cytochrome d ubiquinol oxidase subunit I
MSGIATASFFVLGICAYHLLRKNSDHEFFRRSLYIGMIAAVISSFLVAIVGHEQAQHMVQTQPMKMAAAEALWNTEQPASFSLFTIGDEKDRKNVFAISIPDVLSILSFNSVDGQVQGINNLQAQYVKEYGPGNYVPPVWVTYWSFRLMVGAGMVMILLALIALFLVLRKQLEKARWFLWLLPFAIALPYLANSAGWIMTEIGRQPWIVFGLLTTAKGVSPTVGVASVLISLIVFTLIYGALMAADVFLLVRNAKAEPDTETEEESASDISLAGAY